MRPQGPMPAIFAAAALYAILAALLAAAATAAAPAVGVLAFVSFAGGAIARVATRRPPPGRHR